MLLRERISNGGITLFTRLAICSESAFQEPAGPGQSPLNIAIILVSFYKYFKVIFYERIITPVPGGNFFALTRSWKKWCIHSNLP